MEQIRDSEHCARIWATLMDDAKVETTAGQAATIGPESLAAGESQRPAAA